MDCGSSVSNSCSARHPHNFFFRQRKPGVFWQRSMQSQWRIGDCLSSFDRQPIEAAVEAHGCVSCAPVPHHGPIRCLKRASNSNQVSQMMQASLAVDRRITHDKRHVRYTYLTQTLYHFSFHFFSARYSFALSSRFGPTFFVIVCG